MHFKLRSEQTSVQPFAALRRALLLTILLTAITPGFLFAHEGRHASVHDTVAAIITRMQREMSTDQLINLTAPRVLAFLNPQEREVLGNEHIRFQVNTPVVLTIMRDVSLGDEPFWLAERGFKSVGITNRLANREFDTWEKAFDKGEIGLGVHNLTGRGTHYIVLLRPQKTGDEVKVSDLYPKQLRTAKFVSGVEPFVDQPTVLKTVPAGLEGQLLVQTISDSEEDARLVNLFSKTEFPARNRPEHVVLTWADDPRTSQAIQWRTSTEIKRGVVRYQAKNGDVSLVSARSQRARTEPLSTPTLLNDPLIHRHTALLKGLKPGTTYS